jgi:acyl-coenzyme A thioesterase PaaI-like protein
VAMLADEAACRAATAHGAETFGPNGLAAADAVLHYLRPVKVGPVEARCQVLGTRAGRTSVRVAIHDVGAEDRMVTLGSVTVLAV